MFTPITDNSLAIQSTMDLGSEKTWRPTRRWDLGLNVGLVQNQIQQVKTATVIVPTSPNNQGQAQPVQNVRIVKTPVGNGQIRVSVSFTPNPADRYFQGVALSLTQGNNTPLQVAFGKVSPVTFLTPATSAPSTLSVQSVGSLGDTSLADSPSQALPRLNNK